MTHRWSSHATAAVSATTAASATARTVISQLRRSSACSDARMARASTTSCRSLIRPRSSSNSSLPTPSASSAAAAVGPCVLRTRISGSALTWSQVAAAASTVGERGHDLRDVADCFVDAAGQARCFGLSPSERPQELRIAGDHEAALPGLLIEIGGLEPRHVRPVDEHDPSLIELATPGVERDRHRRSPDGEQQEVANRDERQPVAERHPRGG